MGYRLPEVEVESGFDHSTLNIKGYDLEIETNSVKSRTGIYISKDINYSRKIDLEGVNSHIIVIDIEGRSEIRRIINVYRCFNPQEGISAREKFKNQLVLIKKAMIPDTVLLGDFNLDYEKIYDDNY